MLSTAEAIREDKPGFHGYGSLSFPFREKCNARTTVRKKQKQGQTYRQLCTTAPWCFTRAPARNGKKKKLFLTAWRSVDLENSRALYKSYCSCARVVFAVWMDRAMFLAFAHLGEPQYPLNGVGAAGWGITRARKLSIDLSCLSHSWDEAGAACSPGHK